MNDADLQKAIDATFLMLQSTGKLERVKKDKRHDLLDCAFACLISEQIRRAETNEKAGNGASVGKDNS